jgi:hypothetical protein
MGVIEGYLEAKYGDGGPDADRFEPVPDVVHASRVSECQRKYYWKNERNHQAGASPYFELGRIFEMMYGAALAYEHDPEVTPEVLSRHPPWEVAERSRVVAQDVSVNIRVGGGAKITGESDWVVLEGPMEVQPDRVEAADGSRRLVLRDGTERRYDGEVAKVVETKTKGDIDWPRRDGPDEKHVYQVYPYMHGLDAPGEIAYMERDDWSEHVAGLEYDEDVWLDVKVRAVRHVQNAGGGGTPPTTPLGPDECKWCPFQDECVEVGGSVWR